MPNPSPVAAAPNAERARARTAWLLFAPPLVTVMLGFVLAFLSARLPDIQPLQALQVLGNGAPAPDHAAIGAIIWQSARPAVSTLLIVALLLLALWLAWRAWGWRRVAPVLRGLWLALWAVAAVAFVLQYLNRATLQTRPAVSATVVEARSYPGSEDGPGGATVVLTLPSDAAPRRVLLPGADWHALPRGHALRLSLARGRFWGEYVTGSDAPPAPPAPPAGR